VDAALIAETELAVGLALPDDPFVDIAMVL
jgi:hypothetical protein